MDKLLKLNLGLIFLILLISKNYNAQQDSKEIYINKDTSFTVYSAFAKEVKDYPFIEIANPELPENIFIDSNQVYEEYGKRKLRLDVFYPKTQKQKFPAIILVHGGGWKSGDKSQQIPLGKIIASKGFVAAAVEYRLSPEAMYPAAILDLKAAVRWLRKNHAKYFIDTNKIAALGCSSGGHLVSMLGVTNDNPKFDGSGSYLDRSSKVQAIIDIDGILDFTHPAESGKDNDPKKPSAGKLWLGASFQENPGLWKEASPITWVNKSTPPFLFINSSLNRFHAGRDEFINILESYGTYSEVHTLPNTPHPFWFFHPWFNQIVEICITFLERVFNQ